MPQTMGKYDKRLAVKFGHRVAALRADLQMTQARLADRSGLGRQYISTIENGRVRVSLEATKAIARALGVDLGELVEGL